MQTPDAEGLPLYAQASGCAGRASGLRKRSWRPGKPQAQIRPPRWEQGGGSGKPGSPNRDLVGGGRSVPCLLCPVRRGAFRQTTDCKHWVHQVPPGLRCLRCLWSTIALACAPEHVFRNTNVAPDLAPLTSPRILHSD